MPVHLIELAQGETAYIDEADLSKIAAFSWWINKGGYVCGTGNRYLHRMVLDAPKGSCVSFANGNRLDCRRENLILHTNRNGFSSNKARIQKNKGLRVGATPNRIVRENGLCGIALQMVGKVEFEKKRHTKTIAIPRPFTDNTIQSAVQKLAFWRIEKMRELGCQIHLPESANIEDMPGHGNAQYDLSTAGGYDD